MSELPFLVLWSYNEQTTGFFPGIFCLTQSKSIPRTARPINRKSCQEVLHLLRRTVQKTHRAKAGAQNQLFLIGKMTAWVIRASPEGLPCVISSLSYPHNKLSAASRTSPSSIRLNDWILLCLNVSYMGVFLPAACFCEIHKYCIKCIHFLI